MKKLILTFLTSTCVFFTLPTYATVYPSVCGIVRFSLSSQGGTASLPYRNLFNRESIITGKCMHLKTDYVSCRIHTGESNGPVHVIELIVTRETQFSRWEVELTTKDYFQRAQPSEFFKCNSN